MVISAGFRETGTCGLDLERETLDIARNGGIRLIGPNCLGVMSPVAAIMLHVFGSLHISEAMSACGVSEAKR